MPSEEIPPLRTERVHCNQCGHATHHLVLVERDQPGSEPIGEGLTIDWLTTWTTLECRGCESVCLRRSYWFSEWGYDALPEVKFFPPPISRRPPRWLDQLPDGEQALLTEVYTALHADSRRLAIMGARALLDVVMQKHVGDVGTFADQLTLMAEQGFINERERFVLKAAFEAGSAVAHRGHLLNTEDTETVVDIIEHLLQGELLGAAANGLNERTPVRRRHHRLSETSRSPAIPGTTDTPE